VAARRRTLQVANRLGTCWAGAAFVGLLWVFMQRQTGWAFSLAIPVLLLITAAASMLALRRPRAEPDWRQLAREVELERTVTGADIVQFHTLVRRVPVPESVTRYAVALVRASRPGPDNKLDFVREYINWEKTKHALKNIGDMPVKKVMTHRIVTANMVKEAMRIVVSVTISCSHKKYQGD
jgi:hypothetical protein